ncbi:MAG: T9SS type A sorting domain-containing protein [Bacteroidota bacterium]|nr:T9SS type A sorting domain-containing protein [Bacteroidota bacterium]
MKKLLFTIVIIFPLQLFSQIQFRENIISEQLFQYPEDISAADLDQDNDFDILIASHNDDKISWFENLGNGSFGSQHIISDEATGAVEAKVCDLDGDGDLDIVSALSDASKILWFKNDGLGHFTQYIIDNTTITGPLTINCVDIDNDGDMDVLSASFIDNKIVWYANDGLGNFGPQQIISTAVLFPNRVFSADLDGDGFQDVLSSSYLDNKIAWYKNLGSGNFSQQYIISQQVLQASHVYASDLDGDGDLDVLSTSDFDGEIAWFENDSIGNFGPKQTIASNYLYPSVYTCDIDGDGDEDIVTQFELFLNDGTGLFGNPILVDSSLYISTCSDFDSDNDMDIAGTFGIGNLAWYSMDSTGNFSQQEIITSGINGIHVFSIGDIDSDNHRDIICGSNASNGLTWFKNMGSGNYVLFDTIIWYPYSTKDLACADLDGDGDNDVTAFIEDGSNFYLAWFENDSLGQFGPPQIISDSATAGKTIFITDMDNDGDQDLLFGSVDIPTNINDKKLSLWKNDGTGNFGSEIVIYQGIPVSDVIAADLNGDGNMDIIEAAGQVGWWENLGGATNFSFHFISAGIGSAQQILTADLDNDNDLDVICVADDPYTGNGDIRWWKNNSNGVFTAMPYLITWLNTPLVASVCDIDLDGDLDIVGEQGTDASSLFWFANDGYGNFSSILSIADSLRITSIVTEDMDGDGDYDILYNYQYKNKILWAENLGYLANDEDSACANVPYTFGSQILTTPGTYHDTLQTIFGLDSIVELEFSHIPVPAVSVSPFSQSAYCMSDSMVDLPVLNPIGGTLSGPGITSTNINFSQVGSGQHNFVYSITDTATGCSNSDTALLVIHDNPQVILSPFPQDTFCMEDEFIDLPQASPIGGTFSGAGVGIANINLYQADTGTHEISYHYTDTTTGCSNSDTTHLVVVSCLSIPESEDLGVSVYPNPATNFITIACQNIPASSKTEIRLFDVSAKEISKESPSSFPYQIDISHLKPGVYYLQLYNGEKTVVWKVVKR